MPASAVLVSESAASNSLFMLSTAAAVSKLIKISDEAFKLKGLHTQLLHYGGLAVCWAAKAASRRIISGRILRFSNERASVHHALLHSRLKSDKYD